MDILNSLNKIFIDFFAYIPWAILKLLLWLMYLYLYDVSIFHNVLNLLKNYKLEIVIIFLSLLYFLDIIFSFLSTPFKISRASLEQNEIDKIIKENNDLFQIYDCQNKNNKWFTSSLLDISNNIWYEVPMFFENKILLFKSLRNTLIVFSYINILFLIYYNLINFKLLNILILFFIWWIYLIVIFILKKEIEEYKIWYVSSILNINFYLKHKKA